MQIIVLLAIFSLTPVFAYAESRWDSMIWDTDPWDYTSIPTLNEWGMIILMVLMGTFSIYYLRRKGAKKMKSIFKILNSNKLYKYSLIMIIMVGFTAVVAASVPNTFTAGTTAKSSEVNANFTYLQERLPGADHLWGQGRPSTQRYGTDGVESGLCTGPTSVKFGLSLGIASWGSAASQCPADTWVCTSAERGTEACDTAREDTSVDGLECFDTPASTLDFASNSHDGWLADITGRTDGDAISESGGTGNHWVCMSLPVWCCST